MNTLKYSELKWLFGSLSVLLRSGLGTADSLNLLSEESKSLHLLLLAMQENADSGLPLSEVMQEAKCFPAYAYGMVRAAEHTGHIDSVLAALASYYAERERMERQLKDSLLYPVLLTACMLAVVILLIVRVLPIFEDVYASLGGQLTGLSGKLLELSQISSRIFPIFCIILTALFFCIFLFLTSSTVRRAVISRWMRKHGERGLTKLWNTAHFASLLSLGMQSGISNEEILSLGVDLFSDIPAASECCRRCLTLLSNGIDVPTALSKSGALPDTACRMLSLGLRNGGTDSLIKEIAASLNEEASYALEKRMSLLEPAIVLTMSLLIGCILLSVLLPLIDILSLIG